MKKRIRIEQEEQEDLKITIKVREDALENMQERLEEKTREAEKWREFGEQVCFDRDNQKQLKEERTERSDELEQQVDDLVAEKETPNGAEQGEGQDQQCHGRKQDERRCDCIVCKAHPKAA